MSEWIVLADSPMRAMERFKTGEVVRCRDCRHAITTYQDGSPRCVGPLVSEATMVAPDCFCAWGKEREA